MLRVLHGLGNLASMSTKLSPNRPGRALQGMAAQTEHVADTTAVQKHVRKTRYNQASMPKSNIQITQEPAQLRCSPASCTNHAQRLRARHGPLQHTTGLRAAQPSCARSPAQRRVQPVKACAAPGLRGNERHASAAEAVQACAAAACAQVAQADVCRGCSPPAAARMLCASRAGAREGDTTW